MARSDKRLAAVLKQMITAISVPHAPPLRPLYKNAAIPMQRVAAHPLVVGSSGWLNPHPDNGFLRERHTEPEATQPLARDRRTSPAFAVD
jgi:hypothetical protein